jgi:hypothetical protein
MDREGLVHALADSRCWRGRSGDPDGDLFGHRLRLATLTNLVSSRAAATALAENYVGAATEGIGL